MSCMVWSRLLAHCGAEAFVLRSAKEEEAKHTCMWLCNWSALPSGPLEAAKTLEMGVAVTCDTVTLA